MATSGRPVVAVFARGASVVCFPFLRAASPPNPEGHRSYAAKNTHTFVHLDSRTGAPRVRELPGSPRPAAPHPGHPNGNTSNCERRKKKIKTSHVELGLTSPGRATPDYHNASVATSEHASSWGGPENSLAHVIQTEIERTSSNRPCSSTGTSRSRSHRCAPACCSWLKANCLICESSMARRSEKRARHVDADGRGRWDRTVDS